MKGVVVPFVLGVVATFTVLAVLAGCADATPTPDETAVLTVPSTFDEAAVRAVYGNVVPALPPDVVDAVVAILKDTCGLSAGTVELTRDLATQKGDLVLVAALDAGCPA